MDKILAGTKTMVMRGGKSLTAGSLRASAFISWKGERLHHGDWLIIEKIEDVVVGTSIPYNYEKSKFYTELQLKSLKKILIARRAFCSMRLVL